MQLTTRFVELEGCANFRDLGGYAVAGGGATRTGVLYRSDSLHRLTADDIGRVVDELGIGLAIDLRTDRERAVVGEAPVVAGLEVRHVPTFDAGMQAPMERGDAISMIEGYRLMLAEAAANLTAAIDVIASADQPTVFFCMAGKDRTGLLAALVLGLVGVGDETIVSDYHLTHAVMGTIRARLELEQPESAERWRTMDSDVLSAHEATMQATLEHLRAHWGGAESYADAAGLSAERVDRLRDLLVDR